MDQSIKLITPELWQECGAHAYDLGRDVNDHYMNPGAAAIRDWQFGWHTRRIERAQMREVAQQQEAA